jgi:hypothetical protein
METSHKPRDFEQVLKFFSVAYLLLIVDGLIYNIYYYKAFGITITEYIDLSEILLIFIPLLGNVLLMSLVLLIVYYFLFGKFYRMMVNHLGKKSTLGVIARKWIMITTTLVGSILAIFVMLKLTPDVTKHDRIVIILTCLLMGIYLSIYELFAFLETKQIFKVPRVYLDISVGYFSFIMCTILVVLGNTDFKSWRKRGHDFEIVFKNETPLIRTDSNTIYLGRTKDFLFVYDVKNRSSRVFNVDDIKEFIVREIR